jgi:hypothetical protein
MVYFLSFSSAPRLATSVSLDYSLLGAKEKVSPSSSIGLQQQYHPQQQERSSGTTGLGRVLTPDLNNQHRRICTPGECLFIK